MLQSFDIMPFQVDHVIAEVHHGQTTLENLAWSCFNCNVFKGPNLAGIDPDTRQVTRLFHPRNDTWDDHFDWEGPILYGKTSVGRATVDVLRFNLPARTELRLLVVRLGEMS
jgi:hypothetical protein